MKNVKTAALLNSSSLTRPLLLLSTAASALLSAGPAQALDANALPQGGNVVGGSATFAQSGNTLNVNQSSNRAVIDWRSFNIGSKATTNFNQPSSSSIAVNQVNASTNPSVIQGTLNANGQVWILNPNGVYFGKTATVNAAGIVASTANIDVNAFMSGSNQLQMTGGDSGKVVNKGNITVGQGGLAAFVAPSVRNSGTITATVGKVTLAAGDTYTLDLAGDHLVELGLGATKAVVDQSGKIVNPGGTVEITAKAATQVVDSVINMSGVVDASSATSNGGQITLAADTINTTSTAQLNASGGGTGNGGSISAVANNTGNYAGSFTAQGGAQGGNGGSVETSGQTVNIDPNINVSASAAKGAAGTWTLDPHNVTIVDSATTTGGFAGSSVNSGAILNTLGKGTNVTINATTGSIGGENGDIALEATINAAPTSSPTTGNLTLRGNHLATGTGFAGDTISITGGGSLTLDVNAANAATASNPDTAGATFIGDALAMIGNVSGGATVNLGGSGATTYTEQVSINNPNTAITLAGGFGTSTTTIAAPTPTGSNFTEIAVQGGPGVTIQNLKVDGGSLDTGLASFNGIQITNANATINKVDITGFQASPLGGGQQGIGLLVSENDGNTYSVSLTNSSIEQFQKNATAFKDSNAAGSLTLDIENNTITGSGNTPTIAQNGLELFGSNGATIDSTIKNNTITGISYALATNDAADILMLATNGTSTISGNTFTGTSAGPTENSIGLYISGAASVTATNNNFTNLGYGIDADTFFGSTGPVSVSGGKISGNYEGIYVDPTVNTFSASNIKFSNNSIHFQGSTGQEQATFTGNGNTFDATVVNDAPASATTIYGNLQEAVTDETGGQLDLTGTFTGQVTINAKTFILNGTGTTPAKTMIDAPTTAMANSFTTQVGGIVSQAVQAVVAAVNGASVTLQNLTVDGGTNAGGNPFLVGIGASNSNLTVSNVHVTGVADSVLGANPGGIGIGVYNEDGVDRTVSITGSTVDNFGATGISLQGGHLTATVGGTAAGAGNTVTGAGSTAADRQIGIELFGSAAIGAGTGTITGTVLGNTVTKVSNSGPGDSAALNLVDTKNVTASGNTLTGVNTTDNAWGIAASGSDGLTISDNNISKFQTGVEAFSYWGQQNVTLTGNAITGNAIGVGLDSFGVSPDSSTVTASDNSLAGNAQSVVDNLNNTTGANFAQNWWGTANETTIEASIGGSAKASVDFSPFLTNGQNGTPGNGFTGDLTNETVTLQGSNLSGTGRIQEGIDDVAAADTAVGAGTPGTVTVNGGAYTGETPDVDASNLTSKLGTGANPVTGVTSLTVDSSVSGTELSGSLQANSVTLNAPVTLAGNLTLDTSGNSTGTITIASVDGSTADGQDLTLTTAAGGSVSLGNVSNPFVGTQPELDTVTATGNVTLTGSQYYAKDFNLGAVTLTDVGNSINIHGSGANTAVIIGSVDDDVANNEALTLVTPSGSIKVGDIGANQATATVFDNDSTVFTGDTYNAQSFQMGAVRLTGSTTAITSGAGGISIGSLDGTGNEAQSLTLTANGGSKVSVGDIGDTTALNNVTSTGATILTGTSYEARSFDLGAVTLDAADGSTTTIKTDGVTPTFSGIAIGSVDGTDADQQSLTLTSAGRQVSLGDVGDKKALGAVTSTHATSLTGTNYEAESFTLGAVMLAPTGAVGETQTVVVADDATSTDTGITVASVNGTVANQQDLALETAGSAVSLGNAGANTPLGLIVTSNDTNTLTPVVTTTLTGTNYEASSFLLQSVILDPTGSVAGTPTTTTITADSSGFLAGTIEILSVDGTFADDQNLTLISPNKAAQLGNTGVTTPLGNVTKNAAVTLTGTSYEANSFSFGNVLLDPTGSVSGTATNTKMTADGTGADIITMVTIDGEFADEQNLTLIAHNGTVSLGNVDSPAVGPVPAPVGMLGNVVDTDNNGTTLTSNNYDAASFAFGNLTLDTTTTITADIGGITAGAVDGAAADTQGLTLGAHNGAVSLGNVGVNDRLTSLTDTDNTGTTLTGTTYRAHDGISFGDVALTGATTIDVHAGNVVLGDVSGAGDTLGITAGNGGTVSIGNVGSAGNALGAVTDTNNGGTTLTGTSYEAASFAFGDVTLGAAGTVATPSVTTITSDDATANATDITIASVQGTTADEQSLTLATAAGTSASLGNVSDPFLLPAQAELATLTATGNVTLTGSQYYAKDMDLGAVTLTDVGNTINLHAGDSGTAITIGSVDDDVANNEALTLMAPNGAIKVGDIGANQATATVFDSDPTTFTGDTYNAQSFQMGAVTLTAGTTAITSGAGGISIGSLDGTTADAQGVTLTANGGSKVSLGDVGDGKALGAVTSLDATTLTGTTYHANNFDLGAVTLDPTGAVLGTPTTTTITADGTGTGIITIGTVDGTFADDQNLTLTAHNGTVSLGNVDLVAAADHPGAIVDTDNTGTTLTGSTYGAASFAFGNVTLNNTTTITADTGGITAGAVDGAAADTQGLTLVAHNGAVSLGSVGVNDRLTSLTDTDNTGTTLTGTAYDAHDGISFGNITLDQNASIDVHKGNVAIGNVGAGTPGAGVVADPTLDITAGNGGTVTLGNVGGANPLGAVTDTNNGGTTLTGTSYEAASFAFGDVTIDPTGAVAGTATNTAVTSDNGNITMASVDGTFAGEQNLTLTSNGGTVSLGDVGVPVALGALTINGATTLTGSVYDAGSFNFGALTLTEDTTLDSSSDNGKITIGSVDSDGVLPNSPESLTLTAGTGTVSLGNVGAGHALNNLSDTGNGTTTLTGSSYTANSFDFGNVVLAGSGGRRATTTQTTITADNNGSITLGTVDGTNADDQNLTLSAQGGTVSINDVGDGTSLGAVIDTSNTGTTLTGSQYAAASFAFGALTLNNSTTIGADKNGGSITIASVDGSGAGGQNLTLETPTPGLFPGKGGSVSLGNTGLHTALGAVIDTMGGGTTLTGTTYHASSFDFGNLTLASTATITADGANGITTGTIDGTTADQQGLTLVAAAGPVLIDDVGDNTALGAVTSLNATTLIGSNYDAASFDFGNIKLNNSTTITADNGGSITTNKIDGSSSHGQSLTLKATNGTVSLGDIGDTTHLNTVTDTSNSGTTLTGSTYEANSFAFGAVTLNQSTTITADKTGGFGGAGTIITIGSVNGTTPDVDNLTLNAAGGTVSLGDVDGSPADALGNVIDINNQGTTLTGTHYDAESFTFGAVTLGAANGTTATVTADDTTSTDTGITIASLVGTSTDQQSVTLGTSGSSVLLGNVGSGGVHPGNVTDTAATTLTGSTYDAASFAFGKVTLDHSTTITADTGNISSGTIDGINTHSQNLTLTASHGTVTLGDIGDSKPLGTVTDTNNNGTTLTGTHYDAESFAFGAVTLDAAAGSTTAITADDTRTSDTGITIASLVGTNADQQSVTLGTGGSSVSLGNVGSGAGVHPGNVTSLNATTLTGSTYDAASFDFGNVTLAGSGGRNPTTTQTTITTDNNGSITTAKIDGTNANDQNLTLNAGTTGTVSLGDIGDLTDLGVVIDTANGSTTLTGTSYGASSFAFGAVTLGGANNTTTRITSDSNGAGADITIGSVNGGAGQADKQNLTLSASNGGSVSLGNVGNSVHLGNVTDTSATTLTGTTYDAESFTFGAVTLGAAGTTSTTSIAADDATSAHTGITITSLVGTTTDKQSVTLGTSGSSVSLGNVGSGGVHPGNVTDTAATTLTGTTYNANSFDFGAEVTLGAHTGSTTTITSDDATAGDTGITIASVDGNVASGSHGESLTLHVATGTSASLGNTGVTTHLGAVTSTGATTLTGTTYNANTFNLGAVTLAAANGSTTTIKADSNVGTVITIGSVDGTVGQADQQNLTLAAATGGKVSLGNVDTTPADAPGNVTSLNATTLTGTTYDANSFTFGAVTLGAANGTTAGITADDATTTDTGITIASLVGTAADQQSVTLGTGGSSVSLGNVGSGGVHPGNVTDTAATTLTGTTYNAKSFDFGAEVTLGAAGTATTTITSDDATAGDTGITIASVDGNTTSGADKESLTLRVATGTSASLGNTGVTTHLGAVTSTGATTLSGTTYDANSFDLGAVTLGATGTATTTITSDDATAGDTGITIASVDGNATSGADAESLTLDVATGTSASLGNTGVTTHLGAVTSTGSTTLSGTTYNANSFDLGAVTLGATGTATTTITSDDATAGDTGITIASVDGNATSGADAESLTLDVATGTSASLGNTGVTTHLGAVTSTGSTTLSGTTYNANSFDLGATTLDPAGIVGASTTTITADGTGADIITIGSVKGTTADEQNLTLVAANGTVSLGDVDPVPTDAPGDVTSLSATTLTGTNYDAKSFDFGAVTLDPTTATSSTTPTLTTLTSDNGNVTLASVVGTYAGEQSLTVTANGGTISLGNVGDPALGALTINGATTLTGSTYDAGSFNFGALTLTEDTTLNSSSDNGKITIGSVDSDFGPLTNSPESLTLTAGTGTISLGNTGASHALKDLSDTGNGTTTLTGGTYDAASFEFGNLVLTQNTTITATGSGITTGTIDGTSNDNQSLTLNATAGTVSIGDVGDATPLGDVTDTNNLGTTLTGSQYDANTFAFGAVTLDNSTTIGADKTGLFGAGTVITIASVDGSNAGGQNLTLQTAKGLFGGKGAVSLGNVGLHSALGAVIDTANSGTTLTGTTYNANSFDFGAVTLGATGVTTTTITAGDTTSTDTGITVASLVGTTTDQQSVTLATDGSSVSLGNVGNGGTHPGNVTSASATTLTGSTYNAASFAFGNVTLDNTTTITADTGNISTNKIDGTSKDGQGLTLAASHGTVSLGDIGDSKPLGDVTDTNNLSTTLTGSTYEANSFAFGAVTLDNSTTITADATSRFGSAGTIITIGSVNGTVADQQNLTLNAAGGTVSLGDVDSVPADALGNVVDINNRGTTLTGTNYHAASFDFGDVTLAPPGSNNRNTNTLTTITTDNGGSITTGKVDGSNNDRQALTLNAAGGSVSLGDIGDNTDLGAVTDTNNNGTTLTGSSYDAASFALGNVILDHNTTVTADTGNITTNKIDGSSTNGQSLNLAASRGTVSLGDIGDSKPLGAVTDTNNNGTTLTGTNYEASSFAFGNVKVDPTGSVSGTPTTTTITADTGNISAGRIDGTFADDQNLTLAANGSVSLGDIGDTTHLGNVIDTTNTSTTLTGTKYQAASFAFGNVKLDPSGTTSHSTSTTTITTDNNGNITTAKIDGTFADNQSLTLNAVGGTVSLGDIGDTTHLGNVIDTANAGTTLTGTHYDAKTFDLGAVTLDPAGIVGVSTTTITADSNSGTVITIGSVKGTTADQQNLTLAAGTGGKVSLGDVDTTPADAPGNVTSLNATTLTGTIYDANSFTFGAVTLGATGKTTTSITADDATTTDTGITIASLVGTATDQQSVTLGTGGSSVSLGNVGSGGVHPGAVIDTAATTLTGTTYNANSFDFGAEVTLGAAGTATTTITSDDATAGDTGITIASVDGNATSGADKESLTLDVAAGTSASLGNTGVTTHLGAVTSTGATTLTGTTYNANSFDLGAVTLDPNGTTSSSTSTTTITADGTLGITIGSVDGTFAGNQSLTLVASSGPGPVTLGNVGNNVALGDVISTANTSTTLKGATYNANSFDFDAVTLAAGVDPTMTATGNVTMTSLDGTAAGNESLTINASDSLLGNVGSNIALGSLMVNGPATLTGSSYNAWNELAFDGEVTLTANTTTLNTTGNNGMVGVISVDGTTAGAQGLTIETGTGIVFLGNVGASTALGAVIDTDNLGTALFGTTYNANSFDFGHVALAQFGSSPNSTITVNTSSDNGQITMASVDNFSTLPINESLVLNAGSGNVSLGDVGSFAPIVALNDIGTGTTTLTGDTYIAGSLDFAGPTVLTQALTTLDTSSDNGAITVGSVDGTAAGAQALTLTAGTGTVSLGNTGANTVLGAVIDDNTTTLTGSTYNASSLDFGGAVTLTAGTTTLNTSSDNGVITVSSVDGTTAGGQGLTLNAGTGTVSLGNAGATTRLGALDDTSTTTLTGATYVANSMDFGAEVTLDNDTTLDTSADNGDITLASVDGNSEGGQALILKAGDGTVSLGNTGANTLLSALDDGNRTTLTGTTYATADGMNFGAVTLTGNTTLDTSLDNGGLTVVSVDGTTAGGQNLTLNAGTGLVILGDTGAAVRLGAVTDTSTTKLSGSTYNANSLDFGGALTLTTSTTTLNTSGDNGAITVGSVNGTAAGGQNLSLNAGTGTVSLGNTGTTTRLGAVADTSSTTLTGTTYNANSLGFGGAVTLTGNTTLNTSSDNGALTVASVNGTTTGGQSLTLTAGTGTVSLGNTGATTRLGAVTDNNTTTLTGTTYNANSLNFGGAVTLTGNTSLNTSSDNGAITVGSVNGTTAGGQSLTLTAGTGTVSLGNTGATTALGAVTDNNTTTLTGSTYNASSLGFGGAVTLTAGSTTLNTSSDNGVITVGSVDGTTAGGQGLTLNAGTGTVSLGNTGAKIALGNVVDTSTTTLTGATYTANTFDFGGLTLDNSTTITANSTSGGTIITIGSVQGVVADTQTLTLNAPGGQVSLGDVDPTPADALGVLNDTNNLGTTLTGTNYEGTGFSFGNVTLANTATITADGANGLTIGSLNGTTVGGQGLTLIANSGTITLGNTGATIRLGAFSDTGNTTLTGNTYDANSFTFGGNVTLTAGTTTFNTTQSSTAAGDMNFAGNILGTTNGGQSVVLIAGPGTGAASANGNITMLNGGTATLELDNFSVSGNNFTAGTLFLTGNFTSQLTGILTATINANAINADANRIINSSFTAPNVTIDANAINATNIEATNLTIQATGAITGNWQTLNTENSIDLFLNGQLTSFNPQQLVVEGFALPTGTTVLANGTLVLPAGVLIGLLAPGGGEPRMVLVHSVQELGELLSEGYVAIVIDLNGDQKDDNNMQIASN